MKSDDSSLDPRALSVVEDRARKLLDRSSAWDRFPTPIEDILQTAQLRLAPTNAFDAAGILSYIRKKTADAANYLKSALSKVFGIYDADDSLIHIDETVVETKQNFLKLHEAGHHELPTHRRLFRIFQDCEKTLSPEIADLFEREANNFARFVLFQGDGYARLAADCEMSLKTPMKLAKKFGASVYASAREFARSNHRACVLFVLEPIEYVEGIGPRAVVRRIQASPAFEKEFGLPEDSIITVDHALGQCLPLHRRMTPPVAIPMMDRSGIVHECVAEGFKTTWNVFILAYPTRALTGSLVLPGGPEPSSSCGSTSSRRASYASGRGSAGWVRENSCFLNAVLAGNEPAGTLTYGWAIWRVF